MIDFSFVSKEKTGYHISYLIPNNIKIDFSAVLEDKQFKRTIPIKQYNVEYAYFILE